MPLRFNPPGFRANARDWWMMAAVIAVALVARGVAQLVLPVETGSDAGAYLEMARTALGPGVMHDTYGNIGFYSPGYALFLGTILAHAGVTLSAVATVNLALAAVTTALVYLVARAAGSGPHTAALAALLQAAWVPAIVVSAAIARENLSMPLMAAFALAVVWLLQTRRPVLTAAVAGLCYGLGLLTGASIILTACAVPIALVVRGARRGVAAWALLSFAAAASVAVGPWLWHMQHTLGRPLLTTNASFNLYIGNNPAATGYFVSLSDTPVASQWHGVRARDGELAATDWLGGLARDHILAHPAETAALSAKKIALFWLPDIPDAQDAGGRLVRVVRWAAVLEHIAILLLAIAAAALWRTRTPGERLVIIIILSFWLIHAAAYVMPRYQLPAIPLISVLAAAMLARLTGLAPAGRDRALSPA